MDAISKANRPDDVKKRVQDLDRAPPPAAPAPSPAARPAAGGLPVRGFARR
jgi:hypothetical protein